MAIRSRGFDLICWQIPVIGIMLEATTSLYGLQTCIIFESLLTCIPIACDPRVQRKANHWWQGLWRSYSNTQEWRELQARWYCRQGVIHSMSYPGQHLLVHGGQHGESHLYWRYTLPWRWVGPTKVSRLQFSNMTCRMWPILWRYTRGDAHGFKQNSCRGAGWHESLRKFCFSICSDLFHSLLKPGHEYTKANVKFAISVLQSEPVKKLQAFAENNNETQGKFTIGDEKVWKHHRLGELLLTRISQKHNVFMRVDVSVFSRCCWKLLLI